MKMSQKLSIINKNDVGNLSYLSQIKKTYTKFLALFSDKQHSDLRQLITNLPDAVSKTNMLTLKNEVQSQFKQNKTSDKLFQLIQAVLTGNNLYLDKVKKYFSNQLIKNQYNKQVKTKNSETVLKNKLVLKFIQTQQELKFGKKANILKFQIILSCQKSNIKKLQRTQQFIKLIHQYFITKSQVQSYSKSSKHYEEQQQQMEQKKKKLQYLINVLWMGQHLNQYLYLNSVNKLDQLKLTSPDIVDGYIYHFLSQFTKWIRIIPSFYLLTKALNQEYDIKIIQKNKASNGQCYNDKFMGVSVENFIQTLKMHIEKIKSFKKIWKMLLSKFLSRSQVYKCFEKQEKNNFFNSILQICEIFSLKQQNFVNQFYSQQLNQSNDNQQINNEIRPHPIQPEVNTQNQLIKELKNKLQQKQRQVQQKNNKIREVTNQLQITQNKLNQTQNKLISSQKQLNNVKILLEKSQKINFQLKKDNLQLKRENQQLNKDKEKLLQENASLKQENKLIKQENKQIKQENQLIKSKLQKNLKQLQGSFKILSAVHNNIQNLKLQVKNQKNISHPPHLLETKQKFTEQSTKVSKQINKNIITLRDIFQNKNTEIQRLIKNLEQKKNDTKLTESLIKLQNDFSNLEKQKQFLLKQKKKADLQIVEQRDKTLAKQKQSNIKQKQYKEKQEQFKRHSQKFKQIQSQFNKKQTQFKSKQQKFEKNSKQFNDKQTELNEKQKKTTKVIQNLHFQYQQLSTRFDQVNRQKNNLQIYCQNMRCYTQYFNGDILNINNKEDSEWFVNSLEKYVHKKIKMTNMLYRYDTLNKQNAHSYIDQRPNIVLIARLTNGQVVGAYSSAPFRKQLNIKDQFGALFSFKKRKVFTIKNKGLSENNPPTCLTWDQYYIIWGSSDIRIRLGVEMTEFYSNFGTAGSFYHHQNQKSTVQDFLMASHRNQQFENYELYQIQFEK